MCRVGKEKKPTFQYEEGLCLNEAYKTALPPSPTPAEGGKMALEEVYVFGIVILTALTKLK